MYTVYCIEVLYFSDMNESRRSLSPEPVTTEDITPRIKPAPHKARVSTHNNNIVVILSDSDLVTA